MKLGRGGSFGSITQIFTYLQLLYEISVIFTCDDIDVLITLFWFIRALFIVCNFNFFFLLSNTQWIMSKHTNKLTPKYKDHRSSSEFQFAIELIPVHRGKNNLAKLSGCPNYAKSHVKELKMFIL